MGPRRLSTLLASILAQYRYPVIFAKLPGQKVSRMYANYAPVTISN